MDRVQELGWRKHRQEASVLTSMFCFYASKNRLQMTKSLVAALRFNWEGKLKHLKGGHKLHVEENKRAEERGHRQEEGFIYLFIYCF